MECKSTNTKFAGTKPTMVIDIGWMHSEDGRLVQIRSKQWGGTRKVSVNKNTKPEGILEIGKTLFFIDGMAKKGHISEFSFVLCDFKCQEINNDLTVKEMFNLTHMSNLRFYITTIEKDEEKPSTITKLRTRQKSEALKTAVSQLNDDSSSSDNDEADKTPFKTRYHEQ